MLAQGFSRVASFADVSKTSICSFMSIILLLEIPDQVRNDSKRLAHCWLNSSFPFAAVTYFCLELLGLSGCVLSNNPLLISGIMYFVRNLFRLVICICSIISKRERSERKNDKTFLAWSQLSPLEIPDQVRNDLGMVLVYPLFIFAGSMRSTITKLSSMWNT